MMWDINLKIYLKLLVMKNGLHLNMTYENYQQTTQKAETISVNGYYNFSVHLQVKHCIHNVFMSSLSLLRQ